MFARSVQPDTVSLFSSTGSHPLGLFSIQVDSSLTSDSFVHLLNDTTSLPSPPPPAALISVPSVYRGQDNDTSQGRELSQTVLHIQSPTLQKTFIRCPPLTSHVAWGGKDLGLKHTRLHIQVRDLGRDWSFEVGIVDKVGRQGIIRCSTFQKSPKLLRNRNFGAPPLLHLPLAFPPSSSSPLTAWSTITLYLPNFVPRFASLSHSQTSSEYAQDTNPTERGSSSTQVPLPGGMYSHLAFIKIYATCRVRRVWLSDSAPITRTPWEFELYGN
ncbi:hypothetical protein PAXRUDRAFT_138992 [Paxillus rubicundulus Ve08.2h10]|uniref:CFA20 domain-containing protein n=1 Tax=Paxillus rubicundulus Ve08.2h10 TaxID=930991 RepID=A0A0D0DF21_9AGAM|nr:hypothetical protein PAXRUDRAFT_138992 [Paxillus rubicundulus Ve08.2h10]